MDYSVLTFGAVGDGRTNDTAAIQAAIDACAETGGRVVLPAGHVYRCGFVRLRSDLELHIPMGAVLKGSDDLQDYLMPQNKDFRPQGRDVPSYENCEYTGMPTHYFLYGKDCVNLAITGLGTIDGNEEIFYGEIDRWHIEGSFYPRAPLIFLENSEHLTVTQVTLTNSAFWTVHLVGCRDVLIDGIRILNNLRMANCDGIDPDHCQNVRIANCHIECADDCIVFKTTSAAMQYGPCENITVSNCTLISTSAAIKFGSESEDSFRNILIENCCISRSNRGISLQLRDPGSIENVCFRGISIQTRLFRRQSYWGCAEPITITVLPRKPETAVGRVRNIRFRDIFCESENGILIYGDTPELIEDISLRDVSVHLRSVTDYEKGYHDLRPTFRQAFTEPELRHIHVHNAKGVSFRDCRFTTDDALAPETVVCRSNVPLEGECPC